MYILQFPKFTTKLEASLVKLLENEGIRKMFNLVEADFLDLGLGHVYVSEMTQSITVKVCSFEMHLKFTQFCVNRTLTLFNLLVD